VQTMKTIPTDCSLNLFKAATRLNQQSQGFAVGRETTFQICNCFWLDSLSH